MRSRCEGVWLKLDTWETRNFFFMCENPDTTPLQREREKNCNLLEKHVFFFSSNKLRKILKQRILYEHRKSCRVSVNIFTSF